MYTPDITGTDWKQMIESNSSTLLQLTNKLNQQYKKWYDAIYPYNNVQLAELWSLPETEIAAMRIAFDGCSDFVKFMRNVAVAIRDRETDFVKFV